VPEKTSAPSLIRALPLQPEERPVVMTVSNVGIKFKKTTSGKQKKIGRSLTSIFKLGTKVEDFWALKSISFSVEEGEVLGVVGKNGAGKSTLLRILTGVLSPDEGTIQIDGKVSALLALGAGFMADLSGRENIYLNGIYMGLSKKELTEIYDQIVDFAELADFIDTQIRYYSSGMKARLGFSVAVHVDPEILIIDEVLGAGDKDFRKKAENKMREFMQKAKAIVIASHSTKLITDLCTKCVWLESGSLKAFGPTSEVVKEYLAS
jgi:ABC-type polysaccharide/polyol phosphate transport system ATPase subunit